MTPFSALDALNKLANATAIPATISASAQASPAAPAGRPLSRLPAFDEITLANAYIFDNSDRGKNFEWMWWRATFQVFTETTPFTPSHQNAAWEGNAVLRHPDVFSNVMEKYAYDNPTMLPADLWDAAYMPVLRQTASMPVNGEWPRLGQVQMDGSGTYYEFGSIALAQETTHSGFLLDLILPGGTITFQNFTILPKIPMKPIMRASHDPHRLWLNRKGRKAKS
ncbi:conserved hypothetical protein [Hyphomicrobiales bacterium]|nr:conserved hypothetical protein [Hyphomicrobiales bacterium]CAH1699656.1 conserved hypothetical protein [Hyphomicrobiales bacterium]CAI0343390.1 conserved hypothetical protein [Hyphomicrobiales bacterium]